MFRYYPLFICLILVFGSCKVNNNVIPQKSQSKIQTSDNKNFVFPDDWLGYWEGDLEIFNETGMVQSLPMALDHAVTDKKGKYTWAIIYGLDSIAGRRDYLLNEIDKKNGIYQVDEKNGILLDAFLIDNELVSVFEVMGNSLISTYKREGDELLFDIMMYKSNSTSITGDTIIGTDTIPAVKNYKPAVRQKAVLRKKG